MPNHLLDGIVEAEIIWRPVSYVREEDSWSVNDFDIGQTRDSLW